MTPPTQLYYRDSGSRLQTVVLTDGADRLTIGRDPSCDVVLAWDGEVSRLHAHLERLGADWVIADNGLSRNGTFVNGDRLQGRHRLRDGDRVLVGTTLITVQGLHSLTANETRVGQDVITATSLTPMQRTVLEELCRPYRGGAAYATPASNQDIAEAIYLSVDAVKAHLRALFRRFGIDELPQNQKRAKLVELAFRAGLVGDR